MDIRRRIFWIVLGLIPLLLLAAVETSLRIANYAVGYPLFVALDEQPEFAVANPDIGRRYFSGPSPPTVLGDFFRVDVPDSSIRIVVQGGSTAAGFPFYYGGTFPHILEARLQASLPGRKVQVINTGMAAVNSWTLLDLSREIRALEPDAVLIYAGHNEYYGALGVGSAERLPAGRHLIRTYLLLQRLRLVQLVKHGLTALQPGAEVDEGRMEQLAANRAIRFGSGDYRKGVEQFRRNLFGLTERYAAAGVPVFIGTLVSNERDQPPFVSSLQTTTDSAAWSELQTSASRALAGGKSRQAANLYRRLVQLDTLSASAHFGWARALEDAGDLSLAREAYLRAKDLDELRFRAPEELNDVIRALGRRRGVHLVDVQTAFRSQEASGVVGSRLMSDHLHPTAEGYFEMADAFYEALIRSEVLGADPVVFVDRRAARNHHLLTRVDSLVGAYHVRALNSMWPFTLVTRGRSGFDQPDATSLDQPDALPLDQPSAFSLEQSVQVDDPIVHLARRLYRGEVSWSEANARLIMHYDRTENEEAALAAARSRLQELPYLHEPHVTAARYYARVGRYEEAAGVLYAALTLADRAETHLMLAQLLRRMGRSREALRHVRRAGVAP